MPPINAHTHLELTSLAGRIPLPLPFCDWVTRLIALQRRRPPEEVAESAREGVRRLQAAGVAAVADVTATGASVPPLVEAGLPGVVYYELLGMDEREAPAILRRGQERLEAWAKLAAPRLRFGLSLHAPYTVAPALFRLASAWCAREGVPLCIHVAESPAELEWCLTGTGDIPNVLHAAVGWRDVPFPGCTPVEYLARLGVLEARPLLVHAVHLSEGDVALLAEAACPVVHCPRSNALLQAGRARVPALLAAGIVVALGTDSLASSPSLDVREEMAAAVALHEGALSPESALWMATRGGALALGLDDELAEI